MCRGFSSTTLSPTRSCQVFMRCSSDVLLSACVAAATDLSKNARRSAVFSCGGAPRAARWWGGGGGWRWRREGGRVGGGGERARDVGGGGEGGTWGGGGMGGVGG